MNKTALIVAPHPDDEVLGCGGFIRKLTDAGGVVHVLVISRGTPKLYSDDRIENVRNEALKSHNILGVTNTAFLDFHAPELDTYPLADISRPIAETIRKYKITDLFLPHRGDIHNDHTLVFKAGLVAARPVGIYTVKNIFCYETLSETEWAPPFGDDAFIPNYFVNISSVFQHKVDALNCFKSQIRTFPNPRSIENIESLAKVRGATVGFNYAEAFMIIRMIQA